MRHAAAAIAVVVVACALPASAAAHPRADASAPAAGAVLAHPPSRVVIRLNEPADPVGEAISVTGPDGREVAVGPVTVHGATLTRRVDATARGAYLVVWQVVGDDSHPVRGAFTFGVGAGADAALPGGSRIGILLQSAGHWLSLAGFALGFGVPFAALVTGGMTRRLWRLVDVGIALMLVAEPVALLGQTATLAPSRTFDPALAGDVLLTGYGHATGLRVGVALGLWALVGAVRQSSDRAQWTIPALGVVAALVQADGAHRIAALPGTGSLLLGATHAATFAAWAGCVVVAIAERRGPQLARPAVLSALLLVATGAGLALGQLGAVSDLVETAYGQTLALKLGLVAITLALGAAARRRLELAVALGVLGAASVLVSVAPPL